MVDFRLLITVIAICGLSACVDNAKAKSDASIVAVRTASTVGVSRRVIDQQLPISLQGWKPHITKLGQP